MPDYTKVHNRFKINGVCYSHHELVDVAYEFIKEGLPHECIIGEFLLDWLDNNDFIEVKTSGSTGKPKVIKIKKQAMVESAIMTGDFFELSPGNKALHCLPSNFIAGKMMLVRAMILGLELDIVEPVSKPYFDLSKVYDFCAMIPLQLQNTINDCENIEIIIVGGAPISKDLVGLIQNMKANIFETYGMTETLTHIAVKQLNNFEAAEPNNSNRPDNNHFKLLNNISISTDERSCLVIDAPKLSNRKIITNDVVKLHSEKTFEWLGRYDNVINSGGIKLFPEQIEAKLRDSINNRFFIASEDDKLLGEKVILIVEGDSNSFNQDIFRALEKHEVPKTVYSLNNFI